MEIKFKEVLNGFSNYEIEGYIEVADQTTQLYFVIINKTTEKVEMPMKIKVDRLYRLLHDSGEYKYLFPYEILNMQFPDIMIVVQHARAKNQTQDISYTELLNDIPKTFEEIMSSITKSQNTNNSLYTTNEINDIIAEQSNKDSIYIPIDLSKIT